MNENGEFTSSDFSPESLKEESHQEALAVAFNQLPNGDAVNSALQGRARTVNFYIGAMMAIIAIVATIAIASFWRRPIEVFATSNPTPVNIAQSPTKVTAEVKIPPNSINVQPEFNLASLVDATKKSGETVAKAVREVKPVQRIAQPPKPTPASAPKTLNTGNGEITVDKKDGDTFTFYPTERTLVLTVDQVEAHEAPNGRYFMLKDAAGRYVTLPTDWDGELGELKFTHARPVGKLMIMRQSPPGFHTRPGWSPVVIVQGRE